MRIVIIIIRGGIMKITVGFSIERKLFDDFIKTLVRRQHNKNRIIQSLMHSYIQTDDIPVCNNKMITCKLCGALHSEIIDCPKCKAELEKSQHDADVKAFM